MSTRTALLNKRGVSLVEMMIALVILLLVFLALMQVALLSIDSNVRNALRDEAVNIAEKRMSELRNTPYATLTAGTVTETGIVGTFRNLNVTFTPTRTITDNTTSKEIAVTVSWNWKGEAFTHTVTTRKRS